MGRLSGWAPRVLSILRIVTALLAAAAVNAPATIAARKAREVEQQRAATAGEGDPEALARETPKTLPPSVEEQIADAVAKAKTRAKGIGRDQVDRTVNALDRSRRVSAGLGRFIWHHTPQDHPRLEHRLRDKREYTENTAPTDRAGVLFGCKCWEEPLFR